MKSLWAIVLVSLQVMAFEYGLTPSKVNENVYCYFGKPEVMNTENNGNMVNSCFVDAGTSWLVIDSGPSYMYAKEALLHVNTIKKMPVEFVINTHVHDDHWLGNGYFASHGATIIGSFVFEENFHSDETPRMAHRISPKAYAGTVPTIPTKFISLDESLDIGSLHVKLKTPYMLNLDSEEEATVTIGCAGGVDITARFPITYLPQKVAIESLHVKDLPGGHSGIDIDKNIPNAIKELVNTIQSTQLCTLSGGERRNSIAKSAEASFVSLVGEKKECLIINESEKILNILRYAPHGVVKRCKNDGIMSSVNLATVSIENEELIIHLSARSMKTHELKILKDEIVFYFQTHGCRVKDEGFYAPWELESNEWSEKVASIIEEDFGSVRVETLHAGLECGVIKEQFRDMKMASIGPNIENPHSIRERVEIASVERIFESVKRIIKET